MFLKSKVDELVKLFESKRAYLSHNFVLLDIFKGNLLNYVDVALARQLSGEPYKCAKERIAPINVMSQIVKKQSKIYAGGVSRSVMDGTDADSATLAWLIGQMKPTEKFSTCNRYFNLFKNSLVQPYLNSYGIPQMRILPSDRFIPYSEDKIDCETPTGYLIIQGKKKDENGEYYLLLAVEADEFMYFTTRKEIVTPEYAPENPDGISNLDALPFVYLNREDDEIMPTQDSDILAMTILIPVLFTDINFAHMFQSFSIFYGIDVDDKGIKFGPNAFWSFATKPGSDAKPQVGTITPSLDINGGLQLIANQFALWLNTKGLKAGAVGDVNGSNFASGIAKIIDEMDTSDDRNEQVPYFTDAEAKFWELLTTKLLPVWQKSRAYRGINISWSPKARVETNFSEQVPLVRRSAVIDEVAKEIKEGLTTKERGIKRLNPLMSDQDVANLEAEIAASSSQVPQALNGTQVASLADVLERIASGVLPPESAKIVIMSSFGLSQEIVDSMVDPIKAGSTQPPAPGN